MIKNLVFSGGGIKIFSFLGFIKALKEHQMLDNIISIIGTSAGSIIACLICLDYKYEEIEEISLKIKLNRFNNFRAEDILTFFDNYGIDNGESFKQILKVIIKAKTGEEKYTFKQLYENFNKKLVITVTCLNNLKCEYLNFETNPNMEIIDAIMMSICVPFLFKPISFNNKLYVDGALLNHYPIDYFKDEKMSTFGIIVTDPINEPKTINNFNDYLYLIFNCSFLYNNKKCYDCYKQNTILLESTQNFLDFNIDYNTKVSLIEQAYTKTNNYIITDDFKTYFNLESNNSNNSK